jgi:DGQHR domain-containing protein
MSGRQFTFTAVGAKQSHAVKVFTFAATAEEVLATCEISRLGRTEEGELFGFQRPQIAGHIQEIRDYLRSSDAVLPNAIVVGFLGGVKVKSASNGAFGLTVSTARGKPGFVVDGQQRLTALSQAQLKNFQVFVSCVLCDSDEELRRQFILINNTRPLPKSLIYELLPEVGSLPKRLTSRAFAASLAERLNYSSDSSLVGLIRMHTNPDGVIRDTSLQKVIMNSADSGAIREHAHAPTRLGFGFDLLSSFYGAVADVFPQAWNGQTPQTSRLVHGAGVVAMGYVMETLYSRTGSLSRDKFAEGLEPLRRRVAWTSGRWSFPDGSIVQWDEIENTSRQIQRLALYLVGLVKGRQFTAKARSGKR